MEILIQVLIVVFSGSAIWFINQDKPWSKWGNVLGLIGQPLWLVTTIQNEQWGMLALTVFYIYCWAQGVYNKFLKGKRFTQQHGEAVTTTSHSVICPNEEQVEQNSVQS